MCPITINKALLLQEGILKFELSWTAVASISFWVSEIISNIINVIIPSNRAGKVFLSVYLMLILITNIFHLE